MSWGHCLEIYDCEGNRVGTVAEEVLTLLPRFAMYLGDEYIGQIKKELAFVPAVPSSGLQRLAGPGKLAGMGFTR